LSRTLDDDFDDEPGGGLDLETGSAVGHGGGGAATSYGGGGLDFDDDLEDAPAGSLELDVPQAPAAPQVPDLALPQSRPSGQMAAVHVPARPSGQMAAVRPSGQMAAVRPSGPMAAVRPSGQMAAVHVPARPSGPMAAVQPPVRPSGSMAAVGPASQGRAAAPPAAPSSGGSLDGAVTSVGAGAPPSTPDMGGDASPGPASQPGLGGPTGPTPAAMIAKYPPAPAAWWQAPGYAIKVTMRQLELRQDLTSLRRRRSADVPLYEAALTAYEPRPYRLGLGLTAALSTVLLVLFFSPVIKRFFFND